MRRSPDEKLLVWQMYWRGENFYTQNEIYEGPKEERTIFLGDKNFENLKAWMGSTAAGARSSSSSRAAGALRDRGPAEAKTSCKIVDNSNMKFCLASADLELRICDLGASRTGDAVPVALAMLRHTLSPGRRAARWRQSPPRGQRAFA